MKRGLVIGKFMPVHAGHAALIHFAATHCDELYVSMSYTDHDPIPSTLRLHWLTSVVNDMHFDIPVHVREVKDDFDDESLPLEQRTVIWADVMKRTYPPFHVLASSEGYGEPFARHLGATHMAFDPRRTIVPVSATRIREKPFAYWAFIPPVVRPYFVRKICFFGAESTGKSTMAINMAQHYQTEYVPEVAREVLTVNIFTLHDIEHIGRAHHERIQEKLRVANKLLFCDTDAITTAIYSHHYLGDIPAMIAEFEKQTHYDIYFLLDIDVPWVADGLRDLGNQRERMHTIFKAALHERNIPFIEISGTFAEREALVIKHIDALLARYGG